MTREELRCVLDASLAAGYRLWSQCGIELPDEAERYIAADVLADMYDDDSAASLAATCQSFYLFRRLHETVGENPANATLLGDYFFSQFSKHLIPLDSVALTDAFAAFLQEDIASAGEGIAKYTGFMRSLSAVM